MKLSSICSQCGRMSRNPQTCVLCGAIVGSECCYRPASGLCKICATRARTHGIS